MRAIDIADWRSGSLDGFIPRRRGFESHIRKPSDGYDIKVVRGLAPKKIKAWAVQIRKADGVRSAFIQSKTFPLHEPAKSL